MWIILAGLFDFDMFSATEWVKLAGSHLHGFGGFVFGILILAAIPLYIATTTIIIRTKKPLVTVKIPGFIKRAFAPPPPPPPAPAATDIPARDATTAPTEQPLPENMPSELREVFIRARRGTSIRATKTAFDMSHFAAPNDMSAQPDTYNNIHNTDDEFPLPADFDFSDDPAPALVPASNIPTFSEISFDAPEPAAIPEQQSTPAPVMTDTPKQTSDDKTDGEFVISGDKLIASHTDTDFWIADDTDWFASGKQRPSPVAAVKARAAELGLKPVLYLEATNILDLNERIAAWESDGIRVVTDLKDLDN